MRTAFYIRVSTREQNPGLQIHALSDYFLARWPLEAAADRVIIFREVMGGANCTRPELDRMMKEIRAGKIRRLLVYKLDRLGRSVLHLSAIIQELDKLDVPLICTSQGIETTKGDPTGRLQLNILLAIAEFERELIQERTRDGIAAARRRGTKLGRPASVKLQLQIPAFIKLRKANWTFEEIANECGYSRATVWRALQKIDPRLVSKTPPPKIDGNALVAAAVS